MWKPLKARLTNRKPLLQAAGGSLRLRRFCAYAILRPLVELLTDDWVFRGFFRSPFRVWGKRGKETSVHQMMIVAECQTIRVRIFGRTDGGLDLQAWLTRDLQVLGQAP